MPKDSSMLAAISRIGKAIEDASVPLGAMTWTTAAAAARQLATAIEDIERIEAEKAAELGYRVPNWVWKTWEYQRKTFGSGNGREM